MSSDPTREEVHQNIADFIRKESRKGKLVSRQEALNLMPDGEWRESKESEPATSPESMLGEAIQRNQDLTEILAPDGRPHYCSNRYMTAAYANILLSRKADPLKMMAEIVRENSAIYPRPVPVETFMQPPFEMTEEEIRTCLARMAGLDDLKDIAQTTTSAGTLFLFSRLHLEPEHAAMLAERLDLGPLLDP